MKTLSPATVTEKLRLLLAERRRRLPADNDVLVSATVPVPPVDLLSVVRNAGGRSAAFWEQRGQDLAFAAVDIAWTQSAAGRGRFAALRDAVKEQASSALVDRDPACSVTVPFALAAFSFEPSLQDAAWASFPAGLAVIPRFLFLRNRGEAWLTVNLLTGPDLAEPSVEAIEADLARLTDAGDRERHEAGPVQVETEDREAPARQWRESVDRVLAEVASGAVDKVVLARRARARAETDFDPIASLKRLERRYRSCTLFLFRQGASSFIGATPERLVRLDGGLVRADCLAGSVGRGATEAEDRAHGRALLSDDKERREHAMVVSALREALTPFCSALTTAGEPSLLRLPNVQHLHTPVKGRLRDGHHVLDLVDALHPTPATGGVPRERALTMIHELEEFDRGWYAGPLGWVDADGGGEFVVGIRSALLRGAEAVLYAGCGIVAGSEPEREYAESNLKMQAMLWALAGRQD